MCGICGQYHFAGGQPVSSEQLEAMARSIAHRGPDDEGFHLSGSLGLGFRRLSIIDLAGGHQPMSDEQRSVWVVFNGEIYNFPELRAELERLGHRFRTRSDTEVIIHGYKQWGIDVLEHLSGMFGLAIWDERTRQLFLARDPAGIKLIYYRVHDGSVSFGSELRAVLAATPHRPSLDANALSLFLRYRYTPSPLTLYQGIRKLAPGTLAVFDRGGWSVRRWAKPRPSRSPAPTSDARAVDELQNLYEQAMKRHLLSDVPVGLLLSGGVDSSLLLALMNQHGSGWNTYTVGYGSANFKDDELDDAAATAKHFGARHGSVELDRKSFEAALSRVVSLLEEPIASSSIVPMYLVCERARQDVKVALIGQGPDELFGGYVRHLGVHYGAQWRALPAWLRQALRLGIERLPRSEALKRGVHSLSTEPRMQRYRDVFALLPEDELDGLFRDGVLPEGDDRDIIEHWRELEGEMEDCDELGAFQILEVRSSLPDELLMFADKLSMAHGLEVRVPYLDRDVVEFATRLPAAFKIRHGQRKWLHRRVCERLLPAEILARKKRGFAVNVVDDWFSSSVHGKVRDYLLDGGSLMYQYLDPIAVQRLLDAHRSKRRDNHKLLFSLVVLEEWLRSGQEATSTPRAVGDARSAALAAV
jgi:asparagine synthase (glutamine-hydrolysing)